MDVRFVNAFLYAIKHVFQTMVPCEIIMGKPQVKGYSETPSDVTAAIQLRGDVSGWVNLCFTERTASRVARQFAATNFNETDPLIKDAIGELLNMIVGQAKANFDGLRSVISLPHILHRGQSIGQESLVPGPTLMFPCDTSLGRFRVEVNLRVNPSREDSDEPHHPEDVIGGPPPGDAVELHT
jgi:chemotaxis protein CheX